MFTNKLYGVREAVIALAVIVAFAVMGFGTAYAQTTSSFTPPAGYTQMGSTGIYYNSASGLYYNPMTGQYSNLQPLGQATMNNGGQYIVPSGYTQYNNGSVYYNSQSGWYYDPSTGFFSTSAPQNTGVTFQQASSYNPGTGGTFTPGVPNTGAGGNATVNLAVLAILAAVAATGSILLGRKVV